MTEKQTTVDAFWRSWHDDAGVNSFHDLLEWIADRNATCNVSIERIALSACTPWFKDQATGFIRNHNESFFQIAGLSSEQKSLLSGDVHCVSQQPIILQKEIGYLGIMAKEFDGVMHFLMQAKIEPGNVNKVQISPTIQATRSNFLQLHGGKRPAYLEYFLRNGSSSSRKVKTIVDQVQSEQSSRFFGKRNRNVVVVTDEEVEVLPSHRWMTVGQIKRLMRYPNLVNMDTRTVFSCIPWSLWAEPSKRIIEDASDSSLLSSILSHPSLKGMNRVNESLSNRKMFSNGTRKIVPLDDLQQWSFSDDETAFRCEERFPFEVGFFDIAIDGREVARWNQPLFEAKGVATFVLLCRRDDDRMRFLVHIKEEAGCFDVAELGPTVQREAASTQEPDAIEVATLALLSEGKGIKIDVLLSEEGGRFYCEENRNVLIELSPQEASGFFSDEMLRKSYLWLDFATLCQLNQANNVLNVQLRNLLSLLDPWDRPEDRK